MLLLPLLWLSSAQRLLYLALLLLCAAAAAVAALQPPLFCTYKPTQARCWLHGMLIGCLNCMRCTVSVIWYVIVRLADGVVYQQVGALPSRWDSTSKIQPNVRYGAACGCCQRVQRRVHTQTPQTAL